MNNNWDKTFLRSQHLVRSDEDSFAGVYQRFGEHLITANVGAWYGSACYWRKRAEDLEQAVRQLAASIQKPTGR